MKCTNRLRHIVSVITIASLSLMSLTACGKSSLPLKYTDVNNISTNHMLENKADSFASGYAICNEDILGDLGITIEDASAAGLFDVNNKNVLYAKDIHDRFSPASLTKIMTALVALKYGNIDDVITCSENVSKLESGATAIGLKAGDQLTMNQALYALLIKSANDAGVAIAEHIAGSVDEFANMMNREALSIGATNSHFVNPHGLSDNDHYTTVYDLYLITNEAIKYPDFNEIIHTTDYETVYNDSEGNDIPLKLSTTNLFLRGDYSAPERITVVGGKTGTTYVAGNCLDLIVKDESGNPYIAIILRASERGIVNEEMSNMLKEINSR